MRISRERSGNAATREEKVNRGGSEYEWAGLQPEDPARDDLLARRVVLRLPGDVLLNTACDFALKDGKYRTRVSDDARSPRLIYPHYHVSVALLMPQPTREAGNLGRGLPLLRAEEYIIEEIASGTVVLAPPNTADFQVRTVRVVNNTVPDGEDIDAAARFARVRYVWENRARLPVELADRLKEHEELVVGGDQISITGLGLVARIQAATAEAVADLPPVWATPRTDALPALLRLLDSPLPEPPPVPIEEISPDLPEIRLREVARRRTTAAARPGGSGFRRQVRDAYRSTCIVCGLRLPRLRDQGRAGVDAAHILPDSEFDMNHVSNGLCLCKLHHWAFDEGMIEVTHDPAAGYAIAIPPEAEEAEYDLDFLRPHVGAIPPARLPTAAACRPNPECLRRLRELLYP